MGTVDVAATVRQAVAVQVPIKNPLNDSLTFDLTYGSGQLVGPDVLALEAKQSCDFEFFFAPLVEGDSSGTVTFSSFKVLCHPTPTAAYRGTCMHAVSNRSYSSRGLNSS